MRRICTSIYESCVKKAKVSWWNSIWGDGEECPPPLSKCFIYSQTPTHIFQVHLRISWARCYYFFLEGSVYLGTDLENLWSPGITCYIKDIDPATTKTGHDESATWPGWVVVAAGAGIPSWVVKFISKVCYWQTMNYLQTLQSVNQLFSYSWIACIFNWVYWISVRLHLVT